MDTKAVNVSDVFKHQMIVAFGGNLFRWEELSLKLSPSIIKNHIQSSKNDSSGKRVADSKTREHDISMAQTTYEKKEWRF